MPKQDAFPALLAALKRHLEPYAADLTITGETADRYSLDAPPSAAYPDGLFFGSVVINKNYVSYHLMPVYVFPMLLDDLSAPLRKRMQGKSCFNFTKLDPELDDELAALTVRGFERYRREGIIPA
jgi:hypothetical protein